MSLIDREATFRGNVVDHAVSLSKNDFPQLVASLRATEIYDTDESKWVDFSDYEENEIMAYLVLFGGNNEETLNCQQVKKAVGWDGLSFAGLENMDLSEVKVQFRVEERTYQEKTNLQVTWFDAYDAEPGRTVRKLDANELKTLDAKYKQMLKNTGAKQAPAKAGTVKAKGNKPASPKGPVKKKAAKQIATEAANPSVPATPPTTPETPATPGVPEGHITQQEAWDNVLDLRKDVTDEQLSKIWLDAVYEFGAGADQKNMTEAQWFKVQEKVLEQVSVF